MGYFTLGFVELSYITSSRVSITLSRDYDTQKYALPNQLVKETPLAEWKG